MKKIISIVAVLVLSLCFMLGGCSKQLELPKGDVSSNGGNVVTVGDYVYYANTFVDYTALKGDDNKESTAKQNSLYRVKTNAKGELVRDKDNLIENIEKVYSKMTGFNNSNMFVMNDYMYFTSPNIHKEDKTGNDKFDLTTLFRIKLDGTDLKEILTTETTQGKFFLQTAERPYLLIFDNNKISRLYIENSLKSPEVLVEDVLDAIFPSEYGVVENIYYTKDVSEEEKQAGITGNYLHKLNLNTKETVKLAKPVSETIKLIAYKNNNLYYTLLKDGEALYYSQNFNQYSSFGSNQIQWTILGEKTEEQGSGVSQFIPIDENNVVYKAESKIYLSVKKDSNVAKYDNILIDKDANIEYIDGDYVYYSTAEGVYRISYRDNKEQVLATQKNVKNGSFDIAGEYVYFYAKLDTNSTETYYAFRASIRKAQLGESEFECIAEVLKEDLNGSTTEENPEENQ